MNARKSKQSSLVINVPFELAREIFRESGDIRFEKSPAIITLADSIGKALNINREEKIKRPKPTVLHKNRRAATHRKKPRECTILTR